MPCSAFGGIRPWQDVSTYIPNQIYAAGAQVVTLADVMGLGRRTLHPRGAVGVIIKSPNDHQHTYRVRFTDGVEASLAHDDLVLLANSRKARSAKRRTASSGATCSSASSTAASIGSRAYGLDGAESDTDCRGIYLPPADLHWSLYGVPEQMENEATQEAYWEMQKFIVLALKANPNVLECLYTPLVETDDAAGRGVAPDAVVFLSRLVYQTYNGYVMSQFKKMQSDLRNQGQVKWKHVMHLIRLLDLGHRGPAARFRAGAGGRTPGATAGDQAGRGAVEEVENWRLSLHQEFDAGVRADEAARTAGLRTGQCVSDQGPARSHERMNP